MTTPLRDLTIPVDGSETARRGIACAVALARPGSTLHFCSVVDPATASSCGAFGASIDIIPVLEEAEADAKRVCRDAVATAHEHGIAADGTVLFGPVAAAVVEHAKATRSDAIVIGTHGRSGLARLLLGSVAQHILRLSAVPVVVAHLDDALEADGPITVAIDDSSRSHAALRFAIALAKVRGTELAIETVTHKGRQHWRDAATLLDDAADAARAADVRSERITVAGNTVEEIVDDANARRSAMIIVGSHATTLHTNVAAKVIERSHVPVAVVPSA